jgi:hypothetical protein
LWVEFAALIGSADRPEFSPTRPWGWGCHRRRIPDRVVFEHVIAALVHGSGYERLASPGCSDRTIRRHLSEWAQAGIGPELLRIGLEAYDRMIGLELADLSVDGSITKSPCGGEVSSQPELTGVNREPNAPWPATVTGSRCICSPSAPTITTHPCSNPPWPESAT